MKFCKQCGASLEDDMMFCGQCGASQAESPAEQAEAVAEAVETAAEAAVAETAEAVETVNEAAAETVAAAESVVEVAPEAAAETVAEAAAVVPEAPVVPEAAPVAQPEVAPAAPYVAPVYQQAPVQAAPKKSKKGLIIGIIAAVLVVAAAVVGVIFFLSNSKKETIDGEKLVKIVCYGPDGQGKAAVMLANKDVMLDIINADDDENEYPGLWSYLYDSVSDDDENYPAGVTSWAEENESDYFKKGKVREKTWKELKDDKVSEAQKALKKIKVIVESDKEFGQYAVGDTLKIKLKVDEDVLKDAKVELKNASFEYTFTEDDFEKCTVIDPFKGFEFKCEGYNGSAKISYSYDNCDEITKTLFYISPNYDELYDAKMNGDTVTFTATPSWNYNDGIIKWDGKYYFADEKSLTKVYEVSGLEELQEIDLFEGIQFEYSGMSPNLSISVDESGMPEVLSDNVYYSIDGKSYGYAIGDTVKVIATVYYESDFTEAGYTYDKDKMTYTFTIPYSAPHMLSGTDKEVDYDPELFGRMESAMDEAVGTDKFPGNVQAPGVIKSIDEFKYGEAELFSAIDDQESLRNQIMQIVEIAYTYTGVDGQDKTAYAYIVCQMYDIVVNEDGELEAKYDNTIDVTYMESVEKTSAAFELYRNAEGVDSKKLR